MIHYLAFHPFEGGRQGFRHVSLILYEDGTWTHLDLNGDGVNFTASWREEVIEAILGENMKVCTLMRVEKGAAKHFLRRMTCVSFVKHFLGIDSRALSPTALYRDLLRSKAGEVVYEVSRGEG